MTPPLSPADVGRRVVLRFSLPDGQATDVLGELESWSADTLTVRNRRGETVGVPIADVLAGKVVEPRWARDVAVGERGWLAEAETDVMVADLGQLRTGRRHPVEVAGEEALTATVTGADGEVIGSAQARVVRAWLGISTVRVAAEHRRTGVASALLSALVEHARPAARHAYVQVEAANVGAAATWTRLGFVPHSSYVYRVQSSEA